MGGSTAAAAFVALLFQTAHGSRLAEDDQAGSRRTGYEMSAGMNHSSMSMLYYNTKLMDRIRLQIKNYIFKDEKLQIPDEMLKALDFGKGEKCTKWSDYTTDDMGDKEWQCANTNWIYDPPESVRDKVMHFVGDITDAETRPELNAAGSGLWCGNNMDLDQDSLSAKTYWANCGAPGGGYFNALRCKDKTVYAVIGIRAMNPGVCYPAHASNAEEAVWQVAGQATFSKFDSNENDLGTPFGRTERRSEYAGYGYRGVDRPGWDAGPLDRGDPSTRQKEDRGPRTPHYYPHGQVHEVETDDDHEHEGMLSIYFWGMQSTSGLQAQASPHHTRSGMEGYPTCPARRGRMFTGKHKRGVRGGARGGVRDFGTRRGGYVDDLDLDYYYYGDDDVLNVVTMPGAVGAGGVISTNGLLGGNGVVGANTVNYGGGVRVVQPTMQAAMPAVMPAAMPSVQVVQPGMATAAGYAGTAGYGYGAAGYGTAGYAGGARVLR
eukprot:TRINITY_DN30_c0_g1_i2.p1 TRINITY_DN30_c0_g1~~TRINITY_DN30_c0_g1_i2.p1  ORF type:complete len:490 (+),score=105.13 TRINITY_DN30_c0_g1_i2:151-1620(+)